MLLFWLPVCHEIIAHLVDSALHVQLRLRQWEHLLHNCVDDTQDHGSLLIITMTSGCVQLINKDRESTADFPNGI